MRRLLSTHNKRAARPEAHNARAWAGPSQRSLRAKVIWSVTGLTK